MGDILTFRQQASPGAFRRSRDNPAGVEIIFFPGVRYERYVEPREAAPELRAAPKPRARASGAPRSSRKKQPA